jgi:hypothetical protein
MLALLLLLLLGQQQTWFPAVFTGRCMLFT